MKLPGVIAAWLGLARSLTFNPKQSVRNWMGLPFYLVNAVRWSSLNRDPAFRIRLSEFMFCAADRFQSAGAVDIHYFSQDIWAATQIYQRKTPEHVDVGSRLDGFISHLLPFCSVKYVDLRPLRLQQRNLVFIQGTILGLPFPSNSVPSLSSLHVIEHIGVGRYGDVVDPEGYLKAAKELIRVLAPAGVLLVGTPVGRERLVYDGHRVFDPQTVVRMFAPCELIEFSLIADGAASVKVDVNLDEARNCRYGCGLFVFRKG